MFSPKYLLAEQYARSPWLESFLARLVLRSWILEIPFPFIVSCFATKSSICVEPWQSVVLGRSPYPRVSSFPCFFVSLFPWHRTVDNPYPWIPTFPWFPWQVVRKRSIPLDFFFILPLSTWDRMMVVWWVNCTTGRDPKELLHSNCWR